MFNVQILTTKAECDEVIAFAEEEIDNLQFDQTSASRTEARLADSSAEVTEELQSVQTIVDAYSAAAQTLPEGPAKKQNAKKLRRALFDRDNLLDRKDKNNPVAVLRRSAMVQTLGAELTIYQTLLAEVPAHKATLSA